MKRKMMESKSIKTFSQEPDEKFTSIYIISKGRPQCKTAETLTKEKYPGKWFIVCGNNDETLQQYKDKWGDDRVLVFDWYEEVKHTDLLDNFGVETLGSGAVPARNATIRMSGERGDIRHWQLDDDYENFYLSDPRNMTHIHATGEIMYFWFALLGRYAHATGMANVGIGLGAVRATAPDCWTKVQKRVFNVHCMSSTGVTEKWRGRLNDDVINAIDTYRHGKNALSFCFMQVCMKMTQEEQGGLTEMYKQVGTVRKTAYAILIAPNQVKMVIRFGRYHHKVEWRKIAPKIIDEKWKRNTTT